MNLQVLAYWDLRVERTFADPRATIEDMQETAADGSNEVFTFVFGGAPALSYSFFWFAFWRWTARRRKRTAD